MSGQKRPAGCSLPGLFHTGYLQNPTPAEFIASQPVSCVVIGCDAIRQLKPNEAFARDFEPMSKEEQYPLIRATSPFARELMYYKP